MSKRHSETAIEAQLLANGYVSVDCDSFDRRRAIFVETVQVFIRQFVPRKRMSKW